LPDRLDHEIRLIEVNVMSTIHGDDMARVAGQRRQVDLPTIVLGALHHGTRFLLVLEGIAPRAQHECRQTIEWARITCSGVVGQDQVCPNVRPITTSECRRQ